MPRQENSKNMQDPLERYRRQKEEERERQFHANAEKEDPYDWRKRPSNPESRKKKLVRKLGTTGQIISREAKTGDDRTKYRTRNGITWRTVKTKEELMAEAEAAAEKERLRKKRSYEHRNDKGRPAYTRYIIKLNLVGYPKPYYFGGDEIGWTTYECATQYLGKKKTLLIAKQLIKNLKLNDNEERYDSIEVISIPQECNKDWLFSENMKGITGCQYEEEEYETHEEFVSQKREQNEQRPESDCSSCLCNSCSHKNILDSKFCLECRECRSEGNYCRWKETCGKYSKRRDSNKKGYQII